MIPIARPDIGAEEVAAVTEVLTAGCSPGASGSPSSRRAGRRASATQARDRGQQRDGRPDVHLRRAGPRARRRGHHRLPHLQRDRQRHPVRPVRRRSSSTSSPTHISSTPPGSRRPSRLGRGRSARSTCSACRRHGHDPAIADRHGLAVVEDACQAHGAEFRGRAVGSFGHGAFSLYGTKNMTTGEGGLITTDDDRLADWLRLYRNQGMRERYQPRDPRLQLPPDRHLRGHRARPARQARAEHGPPPRDRGSATTRRSPTCRSRRRSCRPAGRTSSTSTPSTSGPSGTHRRRPRAAGVATGIYYPSRSIGSRTSSSGGSTPNCR